MPTYLGWVVATMPTSPPSPASLEVIKNGLSAAVTSPFTGQQQINDWSAGFRELSVSYAAMSQANGQLWAAFFDSLNGVSGVFQFATGVAALFPNELTTDGTTPRYWRLKAPQVHWTIKQGLIYGVTFECREAI
jgi:hypothetical protein